MKFSEKWLREWVDPPVSTAGLAESLTMAGLEVDGVEPAAPEFSGVVVALVREVQPHPDADRLRVCTVDAGDDEPLQVVCGAPNVRAGMRAPLARVGAVLPGGLKIRKAKLRGVPSAGMLCSAAELGLADAASGLMELPADAPVGQDLRTFMDLDDPVIEIDLTPNRGDCLGIAGVAREVGALERTAVRAPAVEPVVPVHDRAPEIRVEAPADCPRYLGRIVRGVDPGAATPLWMQERLRRSGVRSLGPLVDVTNYVMLELGQPMHAFDLAAVQGAIHVRRARRGESLTLLDGRVVELDPEVLVIADDSRALAMAGIMGGEGSGVGEGTRDVLLEAAFFAPGTIAGRGRRFGLQTDSSYRFERGVDPELPAVAMERATRLLTEIAGGEPGPVTERLAADHLPVRGGIHLRRARLARILGMDIPDDEVVDILTRLGMELEATAEGWQATPPAFRFDIGIEADLIEEVVRVHGYHRVPSRPLHGQLAMMPRPEARVAPERLRRLLVDRDYQEVVSYSFVAAELEALLDPEHEPVALANPISSEMSVMRTSLWPGLLGVVMHNLNRQQERIRIFETGLRFVTQVGDLQQIPTLAAALVGSALPEQWGAPRRPVDFYDLKGDLEALIEAGGQRARFRFEAAGHPALHPGQSARILRDDRPVGWIGALHPRVQRDLDLDEGVLLLEIDLAALEAGSRPAYVPVSRYPAIRRDLAVLVDRQIPAERVVQTVRAAAGEELREVRLFDVYTGEGVERTQKSIALGLILQHYSRTLKDAEVDALMARVVSALKEQLGAGLRA